jgi:IS30 family transposase
MTIKKRKDFKHLTKKERYIIYEMRSNRKTLQEIGDYIGRSKSTISTELKRNKKSEKYMPCDAHDQYKKRLHKSDIYKIDQYPELYKYIIDSLQNKKWAPDAISGRIRLENDLQNISTETIYNYIYNSPKSLELKLYQYLPRKQPKRIKHGIRIRKRNKVIIKNKVSVHDRSYVAKEKTEIGHYEGDLTFHTGNQSKNIGAIVDMASQKIFLTLNKCKSSLTVITGFAKRIKSIPKELRKSLTIDNGTEFAQHTILNLIGIKTYFCDPYSPNQKPLIEKMNSMIHRIFPKNIDINILTKNKLMKIENILNNMPRKILNYKTPNEVWNEYLLKEKIT